MVKLIDFHNLFFFNELLYGIENSNFFPGQMSRRKPWKNFGRFAKISNRTDKITNFFLNLTFQKYFFLI